MTTSPTLACVIPSYDRPEKVRRAAASALRFGDFSEVIVVDDGSPRPVDLSGISDRRLRVVRHESNRGCSAARNTGVREAQTSHLFFLDDDDWLLPLAGWWLRRWLVSAIRRHGTDQIVVVGGLLVVAPGRVPMWRVPPTSTAGEIWGLDGGLVAGGKTFATKQAAVLPRALLDRIDGWDERLRTRTTSELFFRLTAIAPVEGHGWPVYCLNRAPHPKLTADPAQREVSVAYIRRKHPDLLADPARRAVFDKNHAENMRGARTKARKPPGTTPQELGKRNR